MKRSLLRHGIHEQGLTLIELVMATALSGIVFMVLYTILNSAIMSYRQGQVRSNAVQTGRVAVLNLATELRQAERIYSFSEERVHFRMQNELLPSRPGEGANDPYRTFSGDPVQIDYQYDAVNRTLTRTVNSGVPEIMADGVSGFQLRYRDGYFGLIPLPSTAVERIRFIEVYLEVREQEYGVTMRNLMPLGNPVRVP